MGVGYVPAQDAEWEQRAACGPGRGTDPGDFYPEHGNQTPAAAKRVCRRCEVQPECLAYALRNDERFGVWGGLSERERRKLKDSA